MTIDDRVSVAGLYNISLAHDSHSLRRFTHDAVTLTATDPQATNISHLRRRRDSTVEFAW